MYPAFILSVGTLINSLLGLVFYILAARVLGLANFGNLSYFLGLGVLAAELGDWGFSQALVKFGQNGRISQIFNLILFQRLIISLILLVGAWFLGGFYWLSAGVAISLLVLTITSQTFLAQQKFLTQVSSNILGNLVRLAGVFYLLNFGFLTVPAFILTFIFGAVVSFCLGFLILLKNGTINFKTFNFLSEWKNIAHFSPWLGGSQIIASIGAKLDVPILFWVGGPAVAGLYSSAQKLTSIFPQISVALEGVFSARFSSYGKLYKKDHREYYFLSFLFSVGLILAAILSPWFIPKIFGDGYLSATPVFIGLTLALIPFILSGPAMASLVYRHGRTHKHFLISLITTIVTLLGYLLFIPVYGIYGAVISIFIANCLILILALAFNELPAAYAAGF